MHVGLLHAADLLPVSWGGGGVATPKAQGVDIYQS